MSGPEQESIRLDPCPSQVFSWMEWFPDSPPSADGHRPGCSFLRVRYRYSGSEWEFWPVSFEEAREVMNPGSKYGFSIGSAFGQIIKAHKSGRLLRAGEKPVKAKAPKEAARRWLA